MSILDCTISCSEDIARELTDAKKTVALKIGTPLSVLQASTFLVPTDDIKDKDTYAQHIKIMQKFNEDTKEKISSHTDTANAAVNAIAPGIRNQLHVYRNVVNPLIKDLLDKIDYDIQNVSKQPVTDMEVIEWNLPLPYYNDKLEDLSYRYSSHGTVDVTLSCIADMPATSDIINLLSTGIASLDSAINDWIVSLGEDYIANIWTKAFMTKESLLKLLVSKEDGQAVSLLIYLMAEKLVTHEPLDCFKVNRGTFTRELGAIRDFAGKYVYRYIQLNKETIAKKNLVISVIGNKTTVHALVYNDWLENGGSVEILLGNMLSNQKLLNGELLINKGQELINRWNTYYTIQKQQRDNYQVNNIRKSIEKNFRTQMNEARQKIRNNETIDIPNINECDKIEQLFKQEINSYGGINVIDLPTVITRLICRSRFYKTNAEQFLTKLNKIMTDNPDLPPFEASTIATIEYIVEWNLSQVEIK